MICYVGNLSSLEALFIFGVIIIVPLWLIIEIIRWIRRH